MKNSIHPKPDTPPAARKGSKNDDTIPLHVRLTEALGPELLRELYERLDASTKAACSPDFSTYAKAMKTFEREIFPPGFHKRQQENREEFYLREIEITAAAKARQGWKSKEQE